MTTPGTPSSPSPPLSPFKLWRSKIVTQAVQSKERSTSPKKKPQTPSQTPSPTPTQHGRPSLLAGPSLRRTISSASANSLGSVRSSEFARSTVGDHELKLLQQLEGADGADYVATYKQFRKNLLKKNDPIKMAKLTRPKKNIAKFKMAARMIKGKNLAFLCKAQLFSPEKEKDTSLVKKIRQMKVEVGLTAPPPERRRMSRRRSSSMESDEGSALQEKEKEKIKEPIPYDDTMDAEKEKEIEKKFKYIVGQHAKSPFTAEVLPIRSSITGGVGQPIPEQKKSSSVKKESLSMEELRNKAFIRNAQALRKKKEKAAQKAAAGVATSTTETNKKNSTEQPETRKKNNKSKHKKPHVTHPYQAHNYSGYQIELEEKRELQAKLPEKLRQECQKKYEMSEDDEPLKRVSEQSWGRIQAIENLLKEKESITILGNLSQSFSPSHSLLQKPSVEKELGGGPESPDFGARAYKGSPTRRDHGAKDNLISGDALLYAMEREGLFTVDDLEDLSDGDDSEGGQSRDLVEDASEAGKYLFPSLDLLNLEESEHDPALLLQEQEEGDNGGGTAEGVLSASMGTLLFSQRAGSLKQEVRTRPASASRLGGVSNATTLTKSPEKPDRFSYHRKYSLDLNKRPLSANTSPHVRSSSDFPDNNKIPNHIHKKRLVVNRHQSTSAWVT